MVELQHREIPTPALTIFVATNPCPTVADFDSLAFQPVKTAVKADLNQDQGGLCVYCESKLAANVGQLEHIKPKSGRNARPLLCFIYTNYAHSCINHKTCGQKKKDGLLPIEPGLRCNDYWTLSTNGTIEPIANLTRVKKHEVCQTRDMLGLNNDSNLVDERRRWLGNLLEVSQQAHTNARGFLQNVPFRDILTTVL
jgi:uncharacterized protein (TIGR02646 family)